MVCRTCIANSPYFVQRESSKKCSRCSSPFRGTSCSPWTSLQPPAAAAPQHHLQSQLASRRSRQALSSSSSKASHQPARPKVAPKHQRRRRSCSGCSSVPRRPPPAAQGPRARSRSPVQSPQLDLWDTEGFKVCGAAPGFNLYKCLACLVMIAAFPLAILSSS